MTEPQQINIGDVYTLQQWQHALWMQFADTIPREGRAYVTCMLVLHEVIEKQKRGEELTPFERMMANSWIRSSNASSNQKIEFDEEVIL